jgi:nicotinate-nucleotide pyrophosphorylase (carboxylating)
METIDTIIKNALAEDMPEGDITSDYLIKENQTSVANLIAKEDGVISGIDVFVRTFDFLPGNLKIEVYKNNGDSVQVGDLIAKLDGDTLKILKGERVALNLLQRMSGVATLTATYVSCLYPNSTTKILDTRKTTPNLRYLEKRAVVDGGGTNHRYSLSDQVMIKDNHIKAVGSITEAVKISRSHNPRPIKIEVEVESLDQLTEALNTDCDIIMLDNMDTRTMEKAVQMNNGKLLEASGNMTSDRIYETSEIGVDFISVGALTHSYTSLDISLKF